MSRRQADDAAMAVDQPASKRRRIAMACTACRTRKTRCNGGQPRCQPCTELGFECEYEASESSSNVIFRKEYLREWEQRVRVLEEKVACHAQLLDDGVRTSLGQPGREGAHNGHDDGIHLEAHQLHDSALEEPSTDGMAISFVAEHDSAYFGPSSNIAFTRYLLRAMSRILGIESPETPTFASQDGKGHDGILCRSRGQSVSRHGASPSSPSLKEHMLVLPKASEVETLLVTYFNNTGLLFPFIHAPSFMATYCEAKQSKFTSVRRSWLGLLNIMLAMATNTAAAHKTSADERIPRSMVFYERAVSLCKDQMLRGSSVEIVQYLLLMSQYLQGSHNSVQTWMMHGLAVKAAMSMGLHIDSAAHRFSAVDNEVRKRTWYAVIMLDRSLSITFGRPPTVPAEYVKLPLPVSWPESDGADNDPSAILVLQRVSTEFFKASILLYSIAYRAITSLYGHNLDLNASSDEVVMIPYVFELEQALHQWRTELHPSLAMQRATGDQDAVICRFANVLRLRFLNVQSLIYRPFLISALTVLFSADVRPTASSLDRLRTDSVRSCVQSSEEIISLVHNTLCNGGGGPEMLGAWWFTLYFVFNSALVVLGGILVTQGQQLASSGICMTRSADTGLEKSYVENAIAALRALDQGNRIITNCVSYLQYLLRLLEPRVGLLVPRTGTYEDGAPQPFSMGGAPREQGVHIVGNSRHQGSPGTSDFVDFDDLFGNDLELAQFFAPNGVL